jgi:hypothetical protein
MNSGVSDEMILAAVVVIVVGMLSFAYWQNQAAVNGAIVWMNIYELKAVSLIFSEAEAGIQRLKQFRPGTLSLSDMMLINRYTGQYLRWPYGACMLLLGGWIYFRWDVSRKYSRIMDRDTLENEHAQVFPRIQPTAYRSKSVAEEPLDEGDWARAQSPLLFALQNELLVNRDGDTYEEGRPFITEDGLSNSRRPGEQERYKPLRGAMAKVRDQGVLLHYERTKSVFLKQMPTLFRSPDKLESYRLGLTGALMAYANGDREVGLSMFDQMASSFSEDKKQVDISGAKELVDQYKETEPVQRVTKIHGSYESVWLMGLLKQAREMGVVATSEFLWLRPTDRVLWYSLHQVGGRCAWTEAALPWSHYHSERLLEHSIFEPQLEPALQGFKKTLHSDGWLTDGFFRSSTTEESTETAAPAEAKA